VAQETVTRLTDHDRMRYTKRVEISPARKGQARSPTDLQSSELTKEYRQGRRAAPRTPAVPTRTIHTFIQEQVRLRKPLRAIARQKRTELLRRHKQRIAINEKARKDIDFKRANKQITADLRKAILESDASVCARFDQENVIPQRDSYQTYVCQFCDRDFSALPPRSGVRKFCCDAHRQAAYRNRAHKRKYQ